MNNKEFNEVSLLSISEAAKLMKLGKETILELISEGRLGFIQLNKRKKIPYKELLNFIEYSTVHLTPEVKAQIEFDPFTKYKKEINIKDSREIFDEVLDRMKKEHPGWWKNQDRKK